jgi:CubicO group peptidase (beta-lactamase class C family)
MRDDSRGLAPAYGDGDGPAYGDGPPAATTPDGRLPTVRALLRGWVDAGDCLGGQVFVWHGGRVLADLAVGHSGPAQPASPEDVARLYCAVKPVTACCLARVVEAGEASFDDPASRFLPDFTPGGRAAITLRQLLNHTSGMTDAFLDPYQHGFDKLVAVACTWRLPDSAWFREPHYNDLLAWDVLAAVVERIYGQRFADVVDRVVARPAELPGLRMTGPDPARYRRCYKVGRGCFPAVPEPAEDVLFGTVNPAHGGFGGARDLGLLYAELVRCAAGGGRMLGAAYAREITREQSRIDFGLNLGQRACGLGFMTGVRGDGIGGGWSERSFGHAGYVGGYRVVHAFGDVDNRVAVAIRLFSVGAKNNWRFHRLGGAVWADLALPPVRPPSSSTRRGRNVE